MSARPVSRPAVSAFALLALAFTPAPGARSEGPGGEEVRNFFNVLAPDGADPWVFRHTDGRYYATVTTGGNVTIVRGDRLSTLFAGERKVVWTSPRSGPTSRDIWAPELHVIDGKWYVYVAADDGENANHRMYVLENPSANPFEGAFTLKGKIADPASDRWAIDGTVFRAGGRLYFLWSGWEGTKNVSQEIYLAPMANPWTLAGPRVLLSRPDRPWETRGAPPSINEGPQALIKDGRVHIIYSASGSWTDDYCLGLLTARADSNLLDPRSWHKHDGPVFSKTDAVRGPGHCSFTTSPDGAEDWIVYHSARFPGAGWTRLVRAQRFGWTSDGRPDFGRPAPPDRPIPLPSGEPPRRRYEAEDARLQGTARVANRPEASGGKKVGFIDTPDSSVTFRVTVPTPGPYVMSIRFGNGTEGKAVATHRLTVNDGPPRTVHYPNSGWDHWSNAFVHVELKAGENALRFARGDGFAELDCLDVVAAPAPRSGAKEHAAGD